MALNGSIYICDDAGNLLQSMDAGVGFLVDVDLAPGLAGIAASFDLGADETFVEFREFP